VPPGLSLACEHAEAFREVARALRCLTPGPERFATGAASLVVHVVAPDDVPTIPRDATPLAARKTYDVARQGEELIYRFARRACVRIAPGRDAASIWTSVVDSDAVLELVSIVVLELASHRGFFGLHAGAVVRDGRGLVLCGGSGTGKSSLCLTLLHAGYRYLSDDFLLLEVDGGAVRCVPLFRTFNIDPSWAERFPGLTFLGSGMAGRKRSVDPERCYPGSHAASARPAVILFPIIADDPESSVHPLSKRDALGRLLPQTRMSADPETARKHLEALAILMRDAATLELRHGRDFLRAPVATLARLLDPLTAERADAR
jgi:hypothetical protein